MNREAWLFSLSQPAKNVYIDDPIFDDLCNTFSDIDTAIKEAKRIAAWQGTRIQVCHRQPTDEEWEETALVWPDGKIDLTVEGCRFA